MLVLSRKAGEKVILNNNITLTIIEVRSDGRVRLGIEAPRDVPVYRKEILDRIQEGQKNAKGDKTDSG